MKNLLYNILTVVIFFAGLGLVLYPGVSNYINEKHSSKVVANYSNVMRDTSEEEIAEKLAQAEEYNARLSQTPNAFYDPSLVSGYLETLDPMGVGVMGYIYIEKIKVELPIYHGTSEGVLQIGAGHIEGTSLPVGGTGTHCVLSGHRGLPSAKLFTDLNELDLGDTFCLTILNKVLTYQVDQITTVLPTEVDELQIDPEQDYCTLLTCTPYGINTHRLLVRGVRLPDAEEKPGIFVENEAFKVNIYITAPIFSAPLLLIILFYLLAKIRRSRKKAQHDKASAL